MQIAKSLLALTLQPSSRFGCYYFGRKKRKKTEVV
jgi:hypothetical protein